MFAHMYSQKLEEKRRKKEFFYINGKIFSENRAAAFFVNLKPTAQNYLNQYGRRKLTSLIEKNCWRTSCCTEEHELFSILLKKDTVNIPYAVESLYTIMNGEVE
jgi:hypothetical protein